MKKENAIICGDCLKVLKDYPDCHFDMVITSPPYDNLRTYNGSLEWSFKIFQEIAIELKRVLKSGGVIVWVIGDSTKNYNESGTSFNHALYFKEIGLNLHDTMIWHKNNPMPTQHTRYENSFEYMFVLSKGKPKTINILREPSKSKGAVRVKHRAKGGDRDVRNDEGLYKTKDTKIRHNVWNIAIGAIKGLKHTAPFPEKLVEDHINTWSKKGDLILDPFGGSGTTGVICKNLKRKYILIEKEKEYIKSIKVRIRNA